MPVIIEYRGKWLEWCICSSLQGDVLLEGFGSETDARNWAANSGWEVV